MSFTTNFVHGISRLFIIKAFNYLLAYSVTRDSILENYMIN